jgi:hypothetical protein
MKSTLRRDRPVLGTTILRSAFVGLLLFPFGWSRARTSHPRPNSASPAQTAAPATVPVVVELFTSEGCSSCPPADTLLAKLEAQQPVPKTQIIALEEHVDYWNNGGWTDPFSGREWTLRQEEYAAVLKNQNPYTPQLVVDGHAELVGNRPDAALQAIESASAQPKTHVSVSVAPSSKPGVEQAAVLVDRLIGSKHGDKPEIWLAITESGLHSAVSAGENAGSELHHASIVRTFRKLGSINLNKETSFSANSPVHLDSSWNRQHLLVVVFVQDRKSRQILGAATARIAPM